MATFYPDSGSGLVIAVLGLLTLTICGVSVALCWAHLARITRIASGQTDALAVALKRLPPERRIDALAEKTAQQAWAHRWALALASCPNADAQIAVTNELLLDLAHEISVGAQWPASGVRASTLGALLFAVLAFLAGGHVLACGGIIATGLGAAAACAALGMGARKEAARQRTAVDSLVDAVLGRLASGQPTSTPDASALGHSAARRTSCRPRLSRTARRSESPRHG